MIFTFLSLTYSVRQTPAPSTCLQMMKEGPLQTMPAVPMGFWWHSPNLIIFHFCPPLFSNGWCVSFCPIIVNGNWEHLRGGKPFPRDAISCIKISKHKRTHIAMWWIHMIGSINTNGKEAPSPRCADGANRKALEPQEALACWPTSPVCVFSFVFKSSWINMAERPLIEYRYQSSPCQWEACEGWL